MAPIDPKAFADPHKLTTDELVIALNRMPLSPVNFGCTPIQAAALTREAARRLQSLAEIAKSAKKFSEAYRARSGDEVADGNAQNDAMIEIVRAVERLT